MSLSSSRPAFLRTGAAALAATALPSRTWAATPTVKIGYIDSFSGPFADIGPRHKAGVELAIAEANSSGRGQIRTRHRRRQVIARGRHDRTSPVTRSGENRRVDVRDVLGRLARTRTARPRRRRVPTLDQSERYVDHGQERIEERLSLRTDVAHDHPVDLATRARGREEMVLPRLRLCVRTRRLRAHVGHAQTCRRHGVGHGPLSARHARLLRDHDQTALVRRRGRHHLQRRTRRREHP